MLLAVLAGVPSAGCLSATLTDARLTALGRAAVPTAGQSLAQQVDDASACRDRVMDGLFYMGAYTLYNPLSTWSNEEAMAAREAKFAACLGPRGYDLPRPARRVIGEK